VQLTDYGLRLLRIIKVSDSIPRAPIADVELGKEAPIICEAGISRQRCICCGKRDGIRYGIDEQLFTVL